MLTLADINGLSNDPSEEEIRLKHPGVLPEPPPTPSIVPHLGTGETIPKPSAVNAPPPPVTPDWRAKLSATAPHAAAPIPALSPVGAPDLGAPAQPEMPATSESATPGVNF